MNKKWTKQIFISPVLLMIFLFLQSFPSGDESNDGKILYQEYCAGCHGIDGKGNGDYSYLLYPKPRDFTDGKFKIRSTPIGNPPLDHDFANTIRNGMPGTAMPSFSYLKDGEIKSLVDIVKEFSGINNQNVDPLIIPDELPPTDELIALGKSIYTEVGCNMCHGNNGKGDGPSSNQLKDTQGFPIVPKDFTSGVYLGGGTNRDLYLRFVGGMDGTPMPSYGNLAEALDKPKNEENKLAWALVHYVKSLEIIKSEVSNGQPENGILIAAKTNRSIQPEEFFDGKGSLWEGAVSYSIPISRLWQSDNVNYQMVNVQALYNSKYIAVKLEWEDQSKDQELYRVQDFQDGAAIQFSLDGTMGFHGMGSEDHPTDIWFWKAEWQMRTDENTESDIVLAYAHRVSDSDVDTYPTLMNDMAYLSGRDAGNINSESGKTSPVENVTAVGPQTVTPLPNNAQKVMGNGIWDGQKWQLVFVRKLESDSKQKVNFKKGKSIPIAFAIWNGSEKDRNGQKMVSTWYELELKD
jgi:mono/diheme cytochrome c family protein